MRKALEMDPKEKAQRWNKLISAVMHHNAEHWFTSYMARLHSAWDQHSRQHTYSIPRLSIHTLSDKYATANGRLFMLDYEGTLAARASPTTVTYTSPQRTLDALTSILYDSKNTVYVMSGKKPEELDNLFRRVPGLGLVAENGCFIKEAGSDTWQQVANLKKMKTWKQSVRKILEYYQERIEGSLVGELHCSIMFHYNEAKDPQSAARLAGDCANHINDACQNFSVHAVPFEGGILIESTEWSKGTAATRIFENIKKRSLARGNAPPEFLMVAGDAREDEVIYRWANKLADDHVVRDVFTISVSSRNTEAKSTLTQGVTGVLSALQKLATVR